MAALPTGALDEALNPLACVLQRALVGLAVLVMAQPSPSLVLPNCLVCLQDESFKSFSEYTLFMESSENLTEHIH